MWEVRCCSSSAVWAVKKEEGWKRCSRDKQIRNSDTSPLLYILIYYKVCLPERVMIQTFPGNPGDAFIKDIFRANLPVGINTSQRSGWATSTDKTRWMEREMEQWCLIWDGAETSTLVKQMWQCVCFCAVVYLLRRRKTCLCSGTRACVSAGSGTGFTPSTPKRLLLKAKALKANCSVRVRLKMGFLRALSQMTAFPFLYTNPRARLCVRQRKTLCVSSHRLLPLHQ